MPIEFPETFESSCTGAALITDLGLVGIVDDAEKLMGASIEHQPNEDSKSVYAAMFPRYQEMSKLLQQFYTEK